MKRMAATTNHRSRRCSSFNTFNREVSRISSGIRLPSIAFKDDLLRTAISAGSVPPKCWQTQVETDGLQIPSPTQSTLTNFWCCHDCWAAITQGKQKICMANSAHSVELLITSQATEKTLVRCLVRRPRGRKFCTHAQSCNHACMGYCGPDSIHPLVWFE